MEKKNPFSILIVEDERSLAFLLAQSLRRAAPEQYDVHISYTAEETLALLPSHNFELVISNFRLPGMSGMELLSQIRENFKNTRTILMTADGTAKIQADAMRVANAIVAKPFQIPDIVKLVEEVISKPAAPVPLEPPTKAVVAPPVVQDATTDQHLEDLYNQAGARAVMLVNQKGQSLVSIGRFDGIEPERLNQLFVNGTTVAGDLGKIFKTQRAFDLNFYDSDKYEIYIRQVDESNFVAVILDVQSSATRTGAMRFYLKRAVDALRKQKDRANESAQPASKSLIGALAKQAATELAMTSDDSPKPAASRDEPKDIDDQTVLSFEQALKYGLLNSMLFEDLPSEE